MLRHLLPLVRDDLMERVGLDLLKARLPFTSKRAARRLFLNYGEKNKNLAVRIP